MGAFDNKVAYADYRDSNVRISRPFIVTPVVDSVDTVATHNLFTIPDGFALAGGSVIVTTSVTSAGAATVQFTVDGDALTGAIGKADLAAGDVVSLEFGATDGTTVTGAYANGADIQFSMVVGTAALTAGKFTVILDLVHVDAIS